MGTRLNQTTPLYTESMQTESSYTQSTNIRDNNGRGCVGDFLKEKVSTGSRLSVVSAYFTIYAFEALASQLQQIEGMEFLFGEPRFLRSLDPNKNDRKSFHIEEKGLTVAHQLRQRRVAERCAKWIEKKVTIKSIKHTNLLHGKMYHVANDGRAEAVMGSSNFTLSGLGLGVNPNIELNMEVRDNSDLLEIKAWFDELWGNTALVEDVTQEVLHYLEQLYQPNTPEFVYYKTLFHLFEKFLLEQDQGGLLDDRHQLIDTAIWNSLFTFQKDGVKGAINKILTHNGCIIADSVGLGKTYEALAIIKYFELRNDKVLVLCPKKLRENWTNYLAQNNSELNPFVQDRFGYTVLSHTDLSREQGSVDGVNLETLNWGNYDLVVIDESHNFRNNTRGRRDEDGNIIRKTRYERMMDDIINAGVKTKVLLLSATPVNNDLKDLRNPVPATLYRAW
jgi:SNF2 family DNA or RNA helicase